MGLTSALLLSLLVSLICTICIVATRRLHGRLTDDSHAGVQKLHDLPVPRIGGVALLAGLGFGALSLSASEPAEAGNLSCLLLLAALPAFAAGLLEDLTKRVGVRLRLVATLISGLAFCHLTGARIDRVAIPGLDSLLAIWLPSVLFTAIAIGGISNAINLIDGVNGLASGSAIIVLTGYALIATDQGDTALAMLALCTCGALAGFVLLNFPSGKIFLGDAGAYLTGFLLAVLAVLLPWRNPELSPLIGLLALSYPVIETLNSIHRRVVRTGTGPGQPDRLHLHSLVYRSLGRRLAAALGQPALRNPVTGALLWVFPLLSSAMSVLFSKSSLLVILGLAIMVTAYFWLYRRVALLRHTGLRIRPVA